MKFLFSVLMTFISLTVAGQEINEGRWHVVFDQSSKTLTIQNGGKTILSGVYAYANCAIGDATLGVLSAADAQSVSSSVKSVTDCFGKGSQYDFVYTFASGMKLIQSLSFYDGLEYFITRLAVTTGSQQSVRSNRLVPLASVTTSTVMPNDNQNRMLFVPFDNDGFISYASNSLRNEMNSYATTAIFNPTSRFGIVAGAVDHDTWKSAIHVNASDYYKINEMSLISGYTDEHSHDSIIYANTIMPHGTVVADTVYSSRFMFGCFDDWRVGMETFGQACTKVAPRREWAGGKPYGWSSWGVMQTKISYQGVIDVANFIKDNLVAHGFHDAQGRVVLSLDAWWNDNLSSNQIKDFVAYCKANNMIPGLYYGPFCDFGGYADNYVPGTSNKYKYKDLWLKVNGRYKKIDGAYCLDPSHIGTKMFILNDIKKFKDWGIEYIKCDFMSNGSIEADSWYNTKVSTGIQAYNNGMNYLIKQAGDDIYIDLSIAPAFPYRYAHGRRISCDAWGSIDNTKYVMSCSSYGWWLNQVYFSNDPDHMVMKTLDGGGNERIGINRARITSGAITGAFLTGDNFSDNVAAGYPAASRSRALEVLTNDDVNEISRTCGSFRPVEGNSSSTAENLMSYETNKYVYLAAINYNSTTLGGTLSFERLGLDPSDVGEIKELWVNQSVTSTATGIIYNVPMTDARIYRIAKKNVTGISGTAETSSDIKVTVSGSDIVAECPTEKIVSVSVFDISGKAVASVSADSYMTSLSLTSGTKGMYIVKVVTANGRTNILKQIF